MFISIAMYPANCSYDEQAFDNMSEESENNLIIRISLRPIPSQSMVEQAKKHGGFRPPARLPRKRLKTPDSKVAEDRLMKNIIK